MIECDVPYNPDNDSALRLGPWWRTCRHHFFTTGVCSSWGIIRTAAIKAGWRPEPCQHRQVNDYICLDCGQPTIELALAGKLP